MYYALKPQTSAIWKVKGAYQKKIVLLQHFLPSPPHFVPSKIMTESYNFRFEGVVNDRSMCAGPPQKYV